MPQTKQITKSIRLKPEENEFLKNISQIKGVSEAAILKQFVLDGMKSYRVEQAIRAYEHGEADLSAAAKFAGISVYRMMTLLKKRDVALPAETEKFIDGLKTLAAVFGGSDALRQTIAELEREGGQ